MGYLREPTLALHLPSWLDNCSVLVRNVTVPVITGSGKLIPALENVLLKLTEPAQMNVCTEEFQGLEGRDVPPI